MPDPQFSNRGPEKNTPIGSLVGEFMEEKRKELEVEKARKRRRRSPFLVPFLVALCLFVWVAPSLVPPREPPLSPETVERGARLTLYLASLRVRDYFTTHKALPENLTQAGVDTTGIEYKRHTASVFELATRVTGVRMVYRSTFPDSVFLGATLRVRGIN